MSEVEQEILQALAKLADAARTVGTAGPKPDWNSLFARIDELAAQLPRNTEPELIHYLQRKSYEKARTWLEERYPTDPAGAPRRD